MRRLLIIPLLCLLARADDTLSVVLSGRTPALMNALNLLAEGAGFYKEEHLTVTRISVNGALEAVQTCSSGKGDICPVGIEPLITNYADGIRLKMFLSRARHFAYVIAVPEEGPIHQLTDLKGKTIGVHVLGAGASGVFTTASALASRRVCHWATTLSASCETTGLRTSCAPGTAFQLSSEWRSPLVAMVS